LTSGLIVVGFLLISGLLIPRNLQPGDFKTYNPTFAGKEFHHAVT
jgi:hypothetical protein